MLRTDCALQLILQHIIHLIQDLFFLGSHLFLLLLVEKYMGLYINKEQGFSQLAEVCVQGKKIILQISTRQVDWIAIIYPDL